MTKKDFFENNSEKLTEMMMESYRDGYKAGVEHSQGLLRKMIDTLEDMKNETVK